MTQPQMIVGIAWYRQEQYPLMLAVAVDPESMPKTYDEWLARATQTMEGLRERGLVPQKVDIDLKELVAWCEQEGRPLDGAARATYARQRVN